MSQQLKTLDIALKEWASVIAALENGTQILLFRKGGISDAGGEFTVEERDFLLYPTHEHQKAEMLKPEHRGLIATAKPDLVTIGSWARVEKIILANTAEEVARFASQHIWNEDYVHLRLNYKPEKPLYVLALRVFKLRQPLRFPETPDYAGCRSWVELSESAGLAGSEPVLSDSEFQARVASVESSY